MRFASIVVVVAFSGVPGSAFVIPRHHAASQSTQSSTYKSRIRLAASGDEEVSKGMEDAFRQLDAMKALGDDTFTVPEPKVEADEAFAKALQDIDLKGIEADSPPPESEVKLYQEMASEVEGQTEEDLIANMKKEIEGTTIGGTSIPKFDPDMNDTTKFMEKALSEAMSEAAQQTEAPIDKSKLLDNKEIMKEIEAVFDKANDKLMEGLEEIREEQMQLAKASAAESAKKTQELLEEDEQRLAAAEGNMRKMLAKVNEEARNVEEAMEELKQAQEGVENPLSALKSGGIAKQATLVGTVLFGLRSLAEGAAVLGGDATHLMPAVLQAAIAITCLVAFLFL